MVKINEDEFCSVLFVTEIPLLTTLDDADNAATSDAWTTATGIDDDSLERDILNDLKLEFKFSVFLVLIVVLLFQPNLPWPLERVSIYCRRHWFD